MLIDALDGGAVHIHAFDASFIAAPQGAAYPSTPGVLEVRGFLADGGYLSRRFDLRSSYYSEMLMDSFVTDAAFAGTAFTQVAIFAYSCGFNGLCEAFSSGRGQFALDNVVTAISAVPEPSTALLLFSGLGAIAAVARRRRA